MKCEILNNFIWSGKPRTVGSVYGATDSLTDDFVLCSEGPVPCTKRRPREVAPSGNGTRKTGVADESEFPQTLFP